MMKQFVDPHFMRWLETHKTVLAISALYTANPSAHTLAASILVYWLIIQAFLQYPWDTISERPLSMMALCGMGYVIVEFMQTANSQAGLWLVRSFLGFILMGIMLIGIHFSSVGIVRLGLKAMSRRETRFNSDLLFWWKLFIQLSIVGWLSVAAHHCSSTH